jgi:S1-C subfamily serine protease
MFCTQCRAELPEGSQFCLKCGHALPSSVPKTGSPVRSLALVVFGLVIAMAGFFVWRVSTTHTTRPEMQPTAADQPAPSPQPKPNSPPPVSTPRKLSPQDIFQMASGGMTLIETFDDEGHKRGLGSGFVVSADGIALTNYHVIRGAARATAKFGDGTLSEVGGVVAFDPPHDVAVVKLASPTKTVLRLGDSDGLKVGQKVIAIGSPLGLQNTISEGIVSGLRNGIIQMSDPISPGSSGGAVFDAYGNVVGISVATVAMGQNLNFAVPINWAKPYLNDTSTRTLADVTAENTVTNDALDGSVTVPAGQFKNWNFTVNPNAMSNAEVQGQVSATGGMGGKITLALYLQGQTQPIYSCRETNCSIHQHLAPGATYILALDNRASVMFARTVSGKLSFKYVR